MDSNKGDTMKTQEKKTSRKTGSKKTTKPVTKVPRAKQTAKAAKPAKASRPDSKKEIVLALLRRNRARLSRRSRRLPTGRPRASAVL
jgi:hypothetical protein